MRNTIKYETYVATKRKLARAQTKIVRIEHDNARLREALETALSCIDRTGWEFTPEMRVMSAKLDRYYTNLIATPLSARL